MIIFGGAGGEAERAPGRSACAGVPRWLWGSGQRAAAALRVAWRGLACCVCLGEWPEAITKWHEAITKWPLAIIFHGARHQKHKRIEDVPAHVVASGLVAGGDLAVGVVGARG